MGLAMIGHPFFTNVRYQQNLAANLSKEELESG
jgi:hypothetical protein